MIFKSLNDSIYLVSAVNICRCKLKVYIFRMHKIFEYDGCLVIQALEAWLKAAKFEHRMTCFVSFQNLMLGSRWNEDSIDVVAVLIIQYEKMFVPTYGGDW